MPKKRTYDPASSPLRIGGKVYGNLIGRNVPPQKADILSDVAGKSWSSGYASFNAIYKEFLVKVGENIRRGQRGLARSLLFKVYKWIYLRGLSRSVCERFVEEDNEINFGLPEDVIDAIKSVICEKCREVPEAVAKPLPASGEVKA